LNATGTFLLHKAVLKPLSVLDFWCVGIVCFMGGREQERYGKDDKSEGNYLFFCLEPKIQQLHLMKNLNYRTLNDLFPLKQLCFLIGEHIIQHSFFKLLVQNFYFSRKWKWEKLFC
jgi:hypothetical protein